MSEMICKHCGRRGIYWKNLASQYYGPYTYCPHCGGTNCQKREEEFEEEEENQEQQGEMESK